VSLHCHGNVSEEALPRNDRREKDTQTDGMDSGVMKYMPRFIRTGSATEMLMGSADLQTPRSIKELIKEHEKRARNEVASSVKQLTRFSYVASVANLRIFLVRPDTFECPWAFLRA
jgi:hypothetical protein